MRGDAKQHWETIYQTKKTEQMSWTQVVPQTSFDLIQSFSVPKTASIIDIGGGDSKLVDILLEDGYTNITVLDISANALERAKVRLGEDADKVVWIESDILDFQPDSTYDVWHDRATFHFLTTEEQIQSYTSLAKNAASNFLAVGTFAEGGPTKCSGLKIKQYSKTSLPATFDSAFDSLYCSSHNHRTPFFTVQKFVFCGFRRKVLV